MKWGEPFGSPLAPMRCDADQVPAGPVPTARLQANAQPAPVRLLGRDSQSAELLGAEVEAGFFTRPHRHLLGDGPGLAVADDLGAQGVDEVRARGQVRGD